MTRRGKAQLVLLLAGSTSLLSLPASVLASSGGGSLAGSPPSSGSSPAPPSGPVSASAGGVTLSTTATGFLNSDVRFSGSVDPSHAGSLIEIERYGYKTGWAWTPTVQTRVHRDGSYSVQWRANHIGQFSVRAILVHGANGASTAGSWPTVTMIVYRPAVATWYGGPGQFGARTACGVMLRPNTIGVAHRTLPCGTKVAFYYRGRSMIVPVIDRGPYDHAEWDLTEAVASKLGMKNAGVATVWSVSLPSRQ